jgi:CheY-like chemotaxis protein
LSLPAEPLWVHGDPVRLAQILVNLLNNAARYSDPESEILLDVGREDGSLVISVRDHGMGIDPKTLPRLFEMFSRGGRSSGRGQGGLGIGLALARRLAEMHDGTLEARSDGPGKGSEFSLRLPLVDSPSSRTEPSALAADLAHKRILVVDDNHDAADSLAMLLRVLGAEVRVAHSGADALEIFAAYDPAFVLLDIGMPRMDGYEVARRIRTHHPDRRPVLVALTGWGQENDRHQVREAGFDHHLVKPASVEDLNQLLA